MQRENITLKDAEEVASFYRQTTGMKPDYLPLTGSGGLQLEVVQLGELSLVWAAAEGRARWRDGITGPGIQLGLALTSDMTLTALGERVDERHMMLWQDGCELDYVLEGPYVTLEIGLSADLLARHGWAPSGPALRRLAERPGRLIALCERARRTTIGDATAGLLEGRIVDEIEQALSPWLAGGDSVGNQKRTGRELLQRGDRYLDSLDGQFEVAGLAAHLGLSSRSVYRLYRRSYGVGPRRYYELKQLVRLRAALRRASRQEDTVTRIASQLGFADLGRLAARYQRQFDELPSTTLARGATDD